MASIGPLLLLQINYCHNLQNPRDFSLWCIYQLVVIYDTHTATAIVIMHVALMQDAKLPVTRADHWWRKLTLLPRSRFIDDIQLRPPHLVISSLSSTARCYPEIRIVTIKATYDLYWVWDRQNASVSNHSDSALLLSRKAAVFDYFCSRLVVYYRVD